jgi:thioesterase domain-containing protein
MLLSHQFDAGFGIILTTLVQGASLVWTEHQSSDIDAIIDVIIEQSITVVPAIPSLLSLLVEHPRFSECRSLRQLWSGGESMPPDLPARLRDRREIPLWNFYGPTEAAIEVTAANVMDHDVNRMVPIGTPIKDTEVLVLDQNHRPLPPTVPGELAISGPGVARGYLGQPGLTSKRFPSLWDGRRVYLTGDRGRLLPDGSFEFLGRTDNQVKLGGYRIELEEIEQVLRACPLIEDAAVIVVDEQSESARLIGCVTTSESTAANHQNPLQTAERFIASRLPSYKRPRHFHWMNSIPRNSSGKVDRNRLREIEFDEDEQRPHVPPRTELEKYLANKWAEMLGIPQVGINADFFELGGTSLQAAMMANRLSSDLGVHVPTALLFDLADVSRLAERLVELHRDATEQRFGSESISIYDDESNLRLSDTRPAVHPLIADLSGSLANNEMSTRAPIFMIHPPGGIVICYRDLARRCKNRSIYAVRSRGLHGSEPLPETMEAMADDYVEAIKSVAPSGPYQIGGWSLGGLIAYEVARQLLAGGDSVERLILLDTAIPEGVSELKPESEQPHEGLEYGLEFTLEQLAGLGAGEQLPLLWEHAKRLGVLDDDTPQEIVDRTIQDLKHLFHHHVLLSRRYRLEPLEVPLLLVRPQDVPFDVGGSDDRGWAAIVRDVQVEFVSGHHHSMVKPPSVDEIAKLLM